MSYNFTVTDDYYDPQTGTTGGNPTVGNPDITDHQDSPSLQDFQQTSLPDPGLADYTSGQSDTTKRQLLDAALATSASAGQPYPGDIVAANGNGPTNSPDAMLAAARAHSADLASGNAFGGAPGAASNGPTNSSDAMLRAAQAHSADLASGNAFGGAPTSAPVPSLTDYTPPAASTGATGNAGSTGDPTGSHQLSDADWQAQFQKDNGYFDPNFNSRESMLYNAQRGDLMIRPQLEDMAKYDSDAKRVLDAIHATPGFDNGPNSADWRSLHNTELTLREKAMLAGTQQQGDQTGTTQTGYNGKLGAPGQSQYQGGSNQAAIANLEAQRVKEIVPGTLEATLPAVAALRDTLIKDGAQNVGYDPTTNKLHWTGTDGINRALGGMNQAGLLEWADAAAKLKDAASAAAAAAAPPAGGNGYGSGSGSGSGYPGYNTRPTYTPPAAAPPYAYQGQSAPYNPNTGNFNSVVTNKPIQSAPVPVYPGTSNAVVPTQSNRTNGAIPPY